jgi:hypothetical protein
MFPVGLLSAYFCAVKDVEFAPVSLFASLAGSTDLEELTFEDLMIEDGELDLAVWPMLKKLTLNGVNVDKGVLLHGPESLERVILDDATCANLNKTLSDEVYRRIP